MLKNAKNQEGGVQIAERRQHARVQVKSLAYVELDQGNGGLILNISEGGIGVQSAEMILGDHFERIRFRLPKSERWIEVSGKVVWLGKSRKEAGIQFLSLDDDARQQIQSWAYSTAFRPEPSLEPGRFKIVWEAQAADQKKPDAAPSEPPGSGREASGLESMFPSETSMPPAKVSGLNTPSPRDLGGASEAVKHPQPASAEPSASSAPWSSYDLPPVRPTARAEQPFEQARVQPDARGYRAPARENRFETAAHLTKRRDPYASVVVDPPQPTGLRSPAPNGDSNSSDGFPRAAQPIHFSALGYHPPPFEEPSGKGWLAVAAILVALLGVGTILAIGPANVKAVVTQNLTAFYSRYVSSSSLSTTGPPPPAATSEKPPAETSRADTPSASNNEKPLGGSAQQSIVNPGLGKEEGPGEHEGEVSRPARTAKENTDAEGPPRATPSEGARVPTDFGSEETPEDVAIKTRRFQAEHSRFDSATNPTPPAVAYEGASRQAAAPPVPPATQNDRTLDAYAQPTSAAPQTSGSSASPAPIPSGTVAISSHFRSLRGEEPAQTQARQGLVIGQLESIRQPAYPVEAERAHVEGTVQVRATVDQIGRVEIVQAISGPPILIPAAIVAVREWHYGPTIVDGRAAESVNDVAVVFRLANSASSPR